MLDGVEIQIDHEKQQLVDTIYDSIPGALDHLSRTCMPTAYLNTERHTLQRKYFTTIHCTRPDEVPAWLIYDESTTEAYQGESEDEMRRPADFVQLHLTVEAYILVTFFDEDENSSEIWRGDPTFLYDHCSTDTLRAVAEKLQAYAQ